MSRRQFLFRLQASSKIALTISGMSGALCLRLNGTKYYQSVGKRVP
jgi:hypothetical protein